MWGIVLYSYYLTMEKLIEYYNEYNQKKNLKEYYDYIKDIELPEKFDSLTFLKDFCKWLVKNDKIDLEKLDTPEYIDLWDDFMKLSDSDYLIMILSIQDNPIEYLCSILKQ